MSSRLTRCPKCGATYDYMEMIRDGDVRALLEASHRLGSDSRLVFEYTDLFEVSRPLSHKKRLRLVKEIEELLEVCRFRDGGRTHRNISRAGILAGIKELEVVLPAPEVARVRSLSLGIAQERRRSVRNVVSGKLLNVPRPWLFLATPDGIG